MLLTKYGETLNRKNPLSEYPRPQFVRDSYINLNGEWLCEFTKSKSLPESFTRSIIVPFSPETPLSGVNRMLMPDEYLHYKKEFELPDGFNKGRVFVNFGAVDQIATVYLNGVEAGSHKGGYTPFTVELTDYIKPGKNILNVTVADYSDTKEYSRGKQKISRGGVWYTPQSGIWQTVWLESTPKEFLRSVKITPDFDNEEVHFEFFGTQDVLTSIYDGDELIAQTNEKNIKIPDFKPWSPENPFLYKVKFSACGESIQSYFGMRKFSVGTDRSGIRRLFLNNAPYFHNGLLDQGYYPDGYLTPPSNKAMEDDVLKMKELGFNMLRKHIKIEPLLWYHYCDVNGILVWQDMVNGGGKYSMFTVGAAPFVGIKLDDSNYKLFSRTDKECRELYYEELQEIVSHLYNCPCIAMWVPFNEGWGQFDSAKAYDMLKDLDPSRTVDSASGWHDQGKSDVVSKHIYFTPIKVKTSDRPYVLSEFGGYSQRVDGHTFNNKMFGYKVYKTKQSLTKAYKKLFENTIIPQIKDGLSATVYTQVTDVEDELNGILTYDRMVTKLDENTVREINRKVKL